MAPHHTKFVALVKSLATLVKLHLVWGTDGGDEILSAGQGQRSRSYNWPSPYLGGPGWMVAGHHLEDQVHSG